ncbi:MAG: 3-phosphoserine/phosphohydroxythreonine transaminase [Butyricicoccus pullicaecorum]|nr:3-phosphoserine/phosphohydroxythreonine transaminase [Butyricicoccus pullicaecorum]
MTERIFNFSAGPSMLPVPVLERAAAEMLNYHGSGMSVMEMSHRSKVYDSIIKSTEASLRRVMGIPENYKVLFLQGGATMQFSAIPLNLMRTGNADYALTGNFAMNAYKEAKKFGNIHVAASSESENFSYIPSQQELDLSPNADFFYHCSNNTIFGTEWKYCPQTNGVPVVADMSSHILSKPIDVSQYGVIMAGAQKNMGPAGLTVVIVREDLLGFYPKDKMPVMLDWKLMADKESMYNTPPTYAIYMLGLVLDWIENEVGGLAEMQKRNEKKAKLLYDYLDSQSFYQPAARADSRSLMNVTFRTGNEDLDAKFVKESAAQGMSNLKGHRLVGGMRASIYNAMPYEGVETLVDFMHKFAKENG